MALTNFIKDQGVTGDNNTVMTLVDEDGNQVLLVQQGGDATVTDTGEVTTTEEGDTTTIEATANSQDLHIGMYCCSGEHVRIVRKHEKVLKVQKKSCVL